MAGWEISHRRNSLHVASNYEIFASNKLLIEVNIFYLISKKIQHVEIQHSLDIQNSVEIYKRNGLQTKTM